MIGDTQPVIGLIVMRIFEGEEDTERGSMTIVQERRVNEHGQNHNTGKGDGRGTTDLFLGAFSCV